MQKDYDSFFASVEDDILFWILHPEMQNYTTINQDKSVRIFTYRYGSVWFKINIKLPKNSDDINYIISPLKLNVSSLLSPKRMLINILMYFNILLGRLHGDKINSFLTMADGTGKYFVIVYKNNEGNFIDIQSSNIPIALHAIHILHNLFNTKEL